MSQPAQQSSASRHVWVGKPRVCILRTDGTNCDVETAFAFTLAGGAPELVHMNELRAGSRRLSDYQILALPGGFGNGDDVASGKIEAIELMTYHGDQVREFIARHKLIIGICNGFQVLTRMGLLPFPDMGGMHATLAHNNVGHFQCNWIYLTTNKLGANPRHKEVCVFTRGLENSFELQQANGEGRYYAEQTTLDRIEAEGLMPLRYGEPSGARHNPNGSVQDIAGVCSPSGRIFGMMPHAERYVLHQQHPNWRYMRRDGRVLQAKDYVPPGLIIFQNGVREASQL